MGQPADHSRWRRPARARAGVVALAVFLGVTVLAVSGFEDTLTYYRTPTEVTERPPPATERIRLGGMVVQGSVIQAEQGVRFVLTDGATDVTVRSSSRPPQTFRAGQGAVVEGSLASGGVFHADRVLVRHSNEYRPRDDSQ